MGIHFAPDTEYAKEMRKWEATYTEFGLGERPYVKREYPMMLHRAAVLPQGGIDIVDRIEVATAEQRAVREPDGFRATPAEAITALKAQQSEYAGLAGEREWEKRHRLSPQAVAEVEATEEAAGARHLPTIAESRVKPVRKGGWPKGMSRTEAAKRRAEESS